MSADQYLVQFNFSWHQVINLEGKNRQKVAITIGIFYTSDQKQLLAFNKKHMVKLGNFGSRKFWQKNGKFGGMKI